MSEPQDLNALRLAHLVAARMTHDLAGPLGTIMAAAGTAPGAARLDALLAETITELRQRLRLYGLVFGHAEAMRWADLPGVMAGLPNSHRVAYRFAAANAQAVLPAAICQLVLAAAMLGGEALPRGGTVHILANPAAPIMVLPEGRNAAWPHALLERLAGQPLDAPDEARGVLAPWVLALAQAAGCRPALAMAGPGIPPLLLPMPLPSGH